MNVGLPGTGLGGIFYVLLVVWMLVREVAMAVAGRPTHWRRWVAVARSLAIAAAMVGALWAEGLLVIHTSISVAQISASKVEEVTRFLPALAYVPLVALVVLIGAIHLTRLVIRRDFPASVAAPTLKDPSIDQV